MPDEQLVERVMLLEAALRRVAFQATLAPVTKEMLRATALDALSDESKLTDA